MEQRTRRRWCKAEAKRLLGENEHLLRLIIASLVLILLVYALSVLVDGLFVFFDFGLLAPEPPADAAVQFVRSGALLLVAFLFGMPLWYGMRTLTFRMTCGEDAVPSMLLSAFDSLKSLRRVWVASLWILLCAALSGGLVWGLWYGVTLLQPLTESWLDVLLTVAAVLLTPILLLPLAGTHFLFFGLYDQPQNGIFSIVYGAMRATLRALPELLIFWVSFIPWFALAVLSGGVLLVLFVLPYFLLADALLARCLMARAAGEAGQIPYYDSEDTNNVQ
ncbi:MAG: hypothetical protein IKL84_05805 [Clostridia bacterium]|nr:hypothetical protein [Clostridia bacterium]